MQYEERVKQRWKLLNLTSLSTCALPIQLNNLLNGTTGCCHWSAINGDVVASIVELNGIYSGFISCVAMWDSVSTPESIVVKRAAAEYWSPLSLSPCSLLLLLVSHRPTTSLPTILAATSLNFSALSTGV